MLPSIALWLQGLFPDLGFLRVFQYLTFRAVMAALTALVVGLVAGPWFIRRLAALKIGQPIREYAMQTHLTKGGTPTMGGVLILFAIALSTLLGFGLRGKVGGARLLGYSLAGSVLFFLVTNFGAWLGSAGFYPQNAGGLGAAYVAGIPFFQWTVLGTLAYAAILFGGFALLRRRLPALRAQTA